MEETYLVTGGYDSSVQYSARKSVSQYPPTGFQQDLPSLNTGRQRPVQGVPQGEPPALIPML